MREKFSEFYQPTEDGFQDLWDDSHFIFDANVLLNLYMYSDETIEDYWKVFDNIEDRIWNTDYELLLATHFQYQRRYDLAKSRTPIG